jgi:hypothetical protein
MTKVKIWSGTEIREAAAKLYAATYDGSPLSPAPAVKAISEKAGRDSLSIVSAVYFRMNGEMNPLPATAANSARSLRSAVRKRRDGGGTLGRWESVAASAAATLGRPVSEKEAKDLYSKGGGNLDASYTGRGTRVAAPETYVSPAVATEAATK